MIQGTPLTDAYSILALARTQSSRILAADGDYRDSRSSPRLCSLDRGRDQDKALPKSTHSPHCLGCNRPGHLREACFSRRIKTFTRDGCKADRDLQARGKKNREIKLQWKSWSVVPSWSPMSAPAGNGATDEVAIKVDGEDSPLSPGDEPSSSDAHHVRSL